MATTIISRQYTDLDLNFVIHPIRKDININKDELAVINSIKNLLLTSKFDRLFHPDIDSSLNSLLFEPVNPITASILQDEIIRVVNNYEPRVTIDAVNVVAFPDNNYFTATLSVFIGNNTSPTNFNIILKRVR